MMFWTLCGVVGLATVAWVTRPLWPQRVFATLVAAALLGTAGFGYYAMGSWRTQQSIVETAANPEVAQAQMIQGMVDRLAARLKDNPDDVEGWRKLGRSYSVLGRYAESAAAYAQASALAQHNDLELLLSEAESLAMGNERRFDGRPKELLNRALQLSPDDPRALWFSGLAAAQSLDYKAAARHWRRLLKQPLPDNIRTDLQRRLEELENLALSPKKSP